MKLTRRQLIYLIKENLTEDSSAKAHSKPLQRLHDVMKKHNIEPVVGELALQGSHVIFIEDLTKCRQFIKDLLGRNKTTYVKAAGPCNRYFVTNGLSSEIKKAYKKATGTNLEIVTTFTINGSKERTPEFNLNRELVKLDEISPYELFKKGGRFYGTMPVGTHITTKSGEKFDGLVNFGVERGNYYSYAYGDIATAKQNIYFSGFAENICAVNFDRCDKIDFSVYVKPKYRKKTKPEGPSIEYTQSTVSEPFIEDRLGPANIRLNPIEQYTTETGQKGILKTKEQIEATGRSLNDLRIGNFQIQKGGVNYYLVPIDYLNDLSDRELEIMLNPEFDLPDDLDLD